MLHRRQRIALVCASLFVLCSAMLAIVQLSDGAWIQGVLWLAAGVGVGTGYAISFAHWRRA
jgi:hypothetical protein